MSVYHEASRARESRKPLVAVWLVAVVLLLAVALGACGGGGGSSSASPTTQPSGDQPVFRIGMVPSGFDTLNPFVSYMQFDAFAYYQMYPYLAQFPKGTEAQPDLAESWTTSPDGLEWTFKIRSAAVWTDGQPITAQDAAFTINTVVRLQGGAAATLSTAVIGLTKASAPDVTTLVITCERPIAGLLAQMSLLPILPEHVWGPLAKGDGAKLKTITNDPSKETVVVAGPFTVEKYDLKGTTIFKRADTYYGSKPLITGFGVQVFTNADAGIQALKTGQADCLSGLSAASAAVVKSAATSEVQGFGYGPQQLAVNYYKGNTRHPELLEVKTREAISLAIDRSAIVSDVLRDFGEAGGSALIPAYAPQYMSAPMAAIQPDATKANQLLDELGYAKGSDGIRVANGVKMSYTLLVPSWALATEGREAELVKQDLAAIGVEVKQKNVDNVIPIIMGPKGDYADFDMAFWDWAASPDPDLALLINTTSMQGIYNPTGYSNPEYDKLYVDQGAAIGAAKRKAIIDQMSAMLQKDQIEIPTVYSQSIAAWNPKWQNVADAGFFGGWPNYTAKDIFTTLWLQK